MGNPNKAKGGRLERLVTNDLKLIFPHAKTSRLASRLLDNSDVDIAGVPYLIQCKSGYDNVNFKYEKMYLACKQELKKNFSPEEAVHNYPYILIHKKNGTRGKTQPELFQVTMEYNTFLNLLYGSVGQQNKIGGKPPTSK